MERYKQRKEIIEPLVASLIYSSCEDEMIEKAIEPSSNEDVKVSGFNISLKRYDQVVKGISISGKEKWHQLGNQLTDQ